MKKTLLLSGLLLALTASMALAASPGGGINFAWGAGCWPENPVNLKTFACTSNTLSGAIMTGSFAPSIDQPDFVGIEVVVDLQSSSASLPNWWQFFNAGSCRATALSTSADFTAAPQISCVDPYLGLAAGGIAAYQTTTTAPPVPNGLPNAARLKVAYALADPSGLSMATEYYGFKATMNGTKSTGTGACAGCLTAVCIVLNEIKSAGNAGSVARNTTPMANTALGWQARDAVYCAATPTHNATWGQVKSLYR
ncbi:MAG: hypothetical protein HZC42_05135 [Candidatus Eisenbacteria bacterium]|nr:hypothetical protein [Candidatus Eisenbacteria bacterium]